jgi:hypothetical protein
MALWNEGLWAEGLWGGSLWGIPALSPPTDISAEVSGSDIVISWTAAKSVDGYHVYQQIDSGAWTKLNATATTDLTYTLTPTEPGEYNFYVTSIRGTKESAPSAETLLDDVFYFAVNSTQTISGLFSTTGEITVHWGDGTSNTYNGTDQAWSKDYGSAVDELVVIEGSDYITKFTMDQSGADISFDLGHLPINLTYFICYGSNTVSGSLADLPSGLTYFLCSGSNTIDTYTTRTWTTKPSTFVFVPVSPGGLSETEINQLLVDLDEDLEWASGTITLTGTNAAPTGVGLTAANNMDAEGATVTVNS